MLITCRFLERSIAGDRDHASVVVDVELATTSQESHQGDHLSVAVIQPQWIYHKNSEQQNENFADGNRLMSPLSVGVSSQWMPHKPFVVPMEQVPYLLFSFFISGVVAGCRDVVSSSTTITLMREHLATTPVNLFAWCSCLETCHPTFTGLCALLSRRLDVPSSVHE